MRRFVRASAVLAALAIATSATAQAPAPKAAPVDPARLARARQVFEASGGAEGMRKQLAAMFDSIGKMTAAAAPAASADLARAMMKDIAEEESKLVPDLIEDSAQAYAQNLSEKELRDMLAWTTSESGQSIRAKMPVITQQLMATMQPHLAAMMPTMMHKTLDRVCEEQKCTPEVRKIMADAMDNVLKQRGS
jgi:uncharacterized protein